MFFANVMWTAEAIVQRMISVRDFPETRSECYIVIEM